MDDMAGGDDRLNAPEPGPNPGSEPASAPYHRDGMNGRSPMRSRMLWLLAVLVAMLILPALIEKVGYYWYRGRSQAIREQAKDIDLASFTQASRMVAQSVGPSVVAINTLRDAPDDAATDERKFSGGAKRELAGQGSGVIVDKGGYILTNFHVVAGASTVDIHFNGGRSRQATVVGVDADTDLAVLKVSDSGLLPIEWGDSDKLEVGDPVWAVGSPFGLDNTVTFGIISAKDRHGVGLGRYQDFLQTNAAINPGNSGGALVNIRGELVGINTAMVAAPSSGIGFAIPSNLAREVYKRLKEDGTYSRGWAGVQLRELTPERSEELGLKPEQQGALVTRVMPGAPAASSGLQAEDLIVQWNGKQVDDPTRLSLLIAATEPGSDATVELIRQGKPVSLKVRVGKMPKSSRQ
ncbi:MAG: trypsin-like peptidase domain-containing protein [Planctomycetia bacterium]|nr:trypsin-like peptidase domain-containing protein [Planctomycetia bacterium]